ncbi:MAG: nucleotide exchange factor GrpE [Candidatus Azobacteroides sp.]|nr:nucleotide exchange factor GrpE [Candidatus Azobacteroides sp.]
MNTEDKDQENKYLENNSSCENENLFEEIEEGFENEASGNTDNLADQLETEKKKSQEFKDSYLRLMAEFDNYRKRTLREKSEMLKSAGENIITALFPIVDDFERALEVMQTSDDIDANRKGTELIYEKFLSFLSSQGVKAIDASPGSEFNTEFDEAVTTIPASTEDLKGKVVDCVQKGYTLNDKVIRFAKVVVGE